MPLACHTTTHMYTHKHVHIYYFSKFRIFARIYVYYIRNASAFLPALKPTRLSRRCSSRISSRTVSIGAVTRRALWGKSENYVTFLIVFSTCKSVVSKSFVLFLFSIPNLMFFIFPCFLNLSLSLFARLLPVENAASVVSQKRTF
ncbi:unnamed protein product [Ceratitis capitata]|uniref:(Mediterranean fruit fly) hypothetical protein n=1 Tax=Ceratitis capitata TaxID=7213 RepID=A0A811VA71_CERCA|nr:unnamed protein product [Ceratitis capitata]